MIHIWAVEDDFDLAGFVSNLFEMEWPPKSGRLQQFPEMDRAEWVLLDAAPAKMHSGQGVFIERLKQLLARRS